ncbi:MAG: FecR domain-containing protein [Rhodospirillales bacterium]|nr:FecR domain-containing protein [Rhodospirillales bacterium]
MQNDITTARKQRKIKGLLRSLIICNAFAVPVIHSTSATAEVTVEMAGVSAAVTGEVKMAKATGEVGILVESGMPVYLGDRITTTPNSGMQILLLDETVFTIGPNSDIAINEFVYDPATGDGRIVADMARGVMRFVTGKIPLNNPESMDISLPVGSIGIRGTIGLIRSVSAEQANQIVPGAFDTSSPENANRQVFMAVNQGPGLARNDTTSRPGAFAVTDQSGNSQNITGENFGVFVSENVVTEPARFPQAVATFDFSTNLVRTALRGTDENGSSSLGGTPQATAQQPTLTSGQTQQANAQTGATMAGSLDVALAQIGSTSASSSQDEVTSILGNIDTASSSDDSSNDPYTYDALRTVTSGTATTGTLNISGGGISYDFSTTIDYANRTIGVSFSNINDGTGTGGTASFSGYDYTGSSGNVAFDNSAFSYNGTCNTMNCDPSATFTSATNVDFNVKTTNVSNGNASSGTLN